MTGQIFRACSITASTTIACSFVSLMSCGILAKSAPQTIDSIKSYVADSSSLRDKVVYVDFWASWCAPCQKSFPWMKILEDRYYKQGLAIVTINLDPKTTAARAFLAKFNSPLDVVADSAGSMKRLQRSVIYDSTGLLADLYGLRAMPSTFIYGRDGTLKMSHRGFEQKDTLVLDSVINSLLREGTPK